MKKAEFNKKGTRQLVDTGWKTFDRQTNCISTGNVIANTQLSLYIRPYRETECNGLTFKPGELLEADLKAFGYGPPDDIMHILRDRDREKSVILYMFSTSEWVGNIVGRRMRVPFLWVVTDYDHVLIKIRVVHRFGAQMWKRRDAAKEILKYITEERK
jgi:hypothetical protein